MFEFLKIKGGWDDFAHQEQPEHDGHILLPLCDATEINSVANIYNNIWKPLINSIYKECHDDIKKHMIKLYPKAGKAILPIIPSSRLLSLFKTSGR